ncbi:MAG: histidine kinase dimerization/phosphoacceptor domain -containing protein [Methanobacterium sp.]
MIKMNVEYQVTSFLEDIGGWKFVLNSLPDLIAILNHKYEIIWANTAMVECLNTSTDLCLGVKCFEAIHGTKLPVDNCPHAKMMMDNRRHTEEVYEPNLGGYFMVTAAPIMDKSGNTLGSVHIARDITERKIMEDKIKNSLQEKEMLIRETYHRVKNNLMVISSLLDLQARYIEDIETQNIFRDSQNRARSMALIHEKLYQTTDLKWINFANYIKKLSMELFETYSGQSNNIKINFDLEDHELDTETSIPLGLIVNELISNSLKHAFPDGRNGIIKIKFYKDGGKYVLIISDNGIGFPEDLDYKKSDSLGLRIVNSLVDQIHGEIDMDRTQGTKFTIKFP